MKNKIFVILFIGILAFVLINTYFQSRNEFLVNYSFEITKVEISPTKSVIVYNGEDKIKFWNFSIRESDDIKVGDILIKHSCSKYLFIYRKGSLHLKIKENGLFPYKWFCR